MVVVVRARLATPYGARPSTAAFATLYETLVMMAAGGLIAAAGFATRSVAPLVLPIGGGGGSRPARPPGPGAGGGLPDRGRSRGLPEAVGPGARPLPGRRPRCPPDVTRGLLGEGLLWSLAGWTLLGLSQVAVIRAFVPSGVGPRSGRCRRQRGAGHGGRVRGRDHAGGLGVREGVLMATLAPAVGTEVAVVSALALRLAWVIGEVLAAAVLAVARPSLAHALAAEADRTMTSIVIPLFNEGESLRTLHAELDRVFADGAPGRSSSSSSTTAATTIRGRSSGSWPRATRGSGGSASAATSARPRR